MIIRVLLEKARRTAINRRAQVISERNGSKGERGLIAEGRFQSPLVYFQSRAPYFFHSPYILARGVGINIPNYRGNRRGQNLLLSSLPPRCCPLSLRKAPFLKKKN